MPRTLRYRLLVLVAAAGIGVLADPPGAGATEHAARLTDLRWRLDGGATMITAALSAPVRYRTTAGPGGIVVDLWSVEGDVDRFLEAGGIVSRVSLRRLAPEVVRLEIDVRAAARFKVFTGSGLLTVAVFPESLGVVPLPASVAYRAMRVPTRAGRAQVHVAILDPRAQAVVIRPALGGAVIAATETTSTAATRLEAIAAINGNFFTRAGLPIGLIVIDGRVLSTPHPRRVVFAADAAGRPWIGPVEFSGHLLTERGVRIPISAVNRPPRSGGVALYTPEFGPLTMPHPLVGLVRRDRVVGFSSGRPVIPADGYALATAESQQHLLLGLVRGESVQVDLRLAPSGIYQAVQGGPQLVRDGQVFIPYAWEGFGAGFYAIRTARSAIGITQTGKVLFVTVDAHGRQSRGMNLPELASLMRDLGAVQAMNLDGGGSATLVVGGRVVSALPRGGERTVSSMLVALRRPLDRSP
ncbi:MAG: phosphodiester glycosidase family protein [Armatimonadota bacterium]|nr:phosphodiester glycosidase family protein [Armatimonadota bacterium]MDR7519380.1 phosphodiester glycosidase family protein [Armatimonadota bacterium]MDR7549497.1 phosphodiester glycosidase family protein [Armatimonadota bacterium]